MSVIVYIACTLCVLIQFTVVLWDDVITDYDAIQIREWNVDKNLYATKS